MKKIKKINLIFWIIISIFFLVLAIIHPRINNVLLILISIIKCISLIVSKKDLEPKRLWHGTFDILIGLLIVWYAGKYLNILYPYHAPYEYKNDIQNLKAESTCKYYMQFPDKIPAGASKIKWVCVPNLMQGSGYDALFFYADESYLSQVYDTFITEATVYRYSDYGWVSSIEEKEVCFPFMNQIKNDERSNVTVLITYDNKDVNYPHNSGIFINQKQGYICFFKQ